MPTDPFGKLVRIIKNGNSRRWTHLRDVASVTKYNSHRRERGPAGIAMKRTAIIALLAFVAALATVLLASTVPRAAEPSEHHLS